MCSRCTYHIHLHTDMTHIRVHRRVNATRACRFAYTRHTHIFADVLPPWIHCFCVFSHVSSMFYACSCVLLQKLQKQIAHM